VKAALTLAHGNAVPERGFSANNSLLAKDRLALSEQTIVSERLIKDVVRIMGPVADIPVTREMILCAKKAHAEYELHMEKEREEKRQKAAERQKMETAAKERNDNLRRQEEIVKKIHEQETVEAAQIQEQDVAQQIIGEASAKLSLSLQKNDLKDAKVAQVMLSAGNTKLLETSKQLTKIREDKELLRKKNYQFCSSTTKLTNSAPHLQRK
jgi:hypothetical protein